MFYMEYETREYVLRDIYAIFTMVCDRVHVHVFAVGWKLG